MRSCARVREQGTHMQSFSFRAGLLSGVIAALAACSGAPEGPEPTSTSSEANTVCGQTSVKGMDVSHYDGTIDWATAKSSGIAFAIAKATESTSYVDPTFAANWSQMKAHGVVRAAYHFFRANADPTAQATHFVQTVGALEAGDLPLVLDLETMDGQSGATVAANALTFLAKVTQLSGKKAIVYTSPGFIAGLSGTSGFANYTLWVANWGVSCPNVPSPWNGWAFWQHADNGTVSGVPASAVDLDYFNGTLAELQAFGGGTPPPPPSPDGGAKDSGATHDGGGGADSGAAADGGVTPPASDGGGTTPGHDAASGNPGDPGAGASFEAAGSSGGCAMTPRAPAGASALALFALALLRRRRSRA